MLWHAVVAVAAAATATAQCVNYGIADGGSCTCPAGFSNPSSNSCDLPNCGGSLYEPAGAASGPTGDTSSCACADGWTGPACTGAYPTHAC